MTCKILEKLQELCQECEHNQPVKETTWIKDPATGLEWGPIAEKSMTWDEAMDWAKKQGGKLPTRSELTSLFDDGPKEIIESMRNKKFWTTTSCNVLPSGVYLIDFNRGFSNFDLKDFYHYARCVR